MSIKISSIRTSIRSHALRPERIVISHAGTHSESVFLDVEVADAAGLVGYGEAATVLLWSGECAANAKTLVDQFIAPRLVGATFDHPQDALALMDKITVGNSFTKSAIDTALWDLLAKQRKVPAWRLFADREPVRHIPIRGSIGAYPLQQTVALAKGFWESGVRTLKFKVGLPEGNDVERLRAVRDELGTEPVFTVDYNGAFQDVKSAIEHIESLKPLGLAIAEQPTHCDRIRLMAEVRRNVDIPILADESIFTPQHLADAIELDAFDILSIYPGKNGGFSHSLSMIEMAKKAGKPCVIGSNLETDIGQAAMGALAAGLSAFPVWEYACDLLSSMYYKQPSAEGAPAVMRGEYILPDGIGFGVTPVSKTAHPAR